MTYEQATAIANRWTKEDGVYWTAIPFDGGGWRVSAKFHPK